MHDFGVLSLAPAVLAILLAFWTRHVLISLGLSALLGTLILSHWHPLDGIKLLLDPIIVDSISDPDHVRVAMFSLFVAATVALMSGGGGTQALVTLLMRLARSRRSGMISTWLGGLAVFFDDYANCLIVGNAMRPLSDRLGISRQKLAYIVDSTAAPIASIALVSTWVGYEVSLMQDGLKAAGSTQEAYAFFVEGIGYRSYSLFTIVFVGVIVWTGRDFGPMRRAEQRAQSQELVHPPLPDKPPLPQLLLGTLPVINLVLMTFVLLWRDGSQGLAPGAPLFEILGNADAYGAMLQASLSSMVMAMLLTMWGGKLGPRRTADLALEGMKELFEALVVLILAWSLGSVMGELQAADYLVSLLKEGLSPWALPTLVFCIAALTSFSTGTSFGTMAILVPIALPLAFAISSDPVIPLAASSAVLSGACWGDHCSPISDTTVLSSAGAGCDHVAHVRTQIPYAMAAGLISIVFGTLPAGAGISLWISLPLGCLACYLVVRLLGERPIPAASAVAGADLLDHRTADRQDHHPDQQPLDGGHG